MQIDMTYKITCADINLNMIIVYTTNINDAKRIADVLHADSASGVAYFVWNIDSDAKVYCTNYLV